MTDLPAQTADLRSKLVNAITYWCRCPADTTPVGADGVCVDCGVRVDAAMTVFQPVLDKQTAAHRSEIESLQRTADLCREKDWAEIARLRERVRFLDDASKAASLLWSSERKVSARLRTAWASARIGRAKVRQELDCQLCMKNERERERARAESAETALTDAENRHSRQLADRDEEIVEAGRQIAKLHDERERLRVALELIGTRCESFTGPLTCVDDDTRSPHGKYLVDRWCDGCIARMALKQPEEGHYV